MTSINHYLPKFLICKLIVDHPFHVDVDGELFTTSSINKAQADYKDLYYGLQNLVAKKREAMKSISIEAWGKFKSSRGIGKNELRDKRPHRAMLCSCAESFSMQTKQVLRPCTV